MRSVKLPGQEPCKVVVLRFLQTMKAAGSPIVTVDTVAKNTGRGEQNVRSALLDLALTGSVRRVDKVGPRGGVGYELV